MGNSGAQRPEGGTVGESESGPGAFEAVKREAKGANERAAGMCGGEGG